MRLDVPDPSDTPQFYDDLLSDLKKTIGKYFSDNSEEIDNLSCMELLERSETYKETQADELNDIK